MEARISGGENQTFNKRARRMLYVPLALSIVAGMTAPLYASRLINFCFPAFELGVSAAKGDTLGISHALSRGAAINAQNGYAGRTALMVAAMHGRNKAVSLLLARGANPSLLDDKGNTARALAHNGKHEDTARLFPDRQ